MEADFTLIQVDKIEPLEFRIPIATQNESESDVIKFVDSETVNREKVISIENKKAAYISKSYFSSLNSHVVPPTIIPLKEQHTFTEWEQVQSSNLANIFKDFIKFNTRSIIRHLEMEKQTKQKIEYLDRLRENFQEFLLRIKDKQ